MRIHLERKDYAAAINMADDAVTTRLQASFLARAYFENQQTANAIDTLTRFKQRSPSLWKAIDETRLTEFKNAQNGIAIQLRDEPKAHAVYCESDWKD
ncbi:Uncharacterised protein [BD1-7 clade bacterium]|uniref:Uncharacterized protein n=1 Tax=BD1-7 clade bacterium TaxID=2029982 RepID=A0A5S9PGZ6_9GAMM|nr:Uncharacterised protein [BD1-7 clade bacterium]CAA0103344.1 Uncharacterised protein [BD1-7 clade bacterium]